MNLRRVMIAAIVAACTAAPSETALAREKEGEDGPIAPPALIAAAAGDLAALKRMASDKSKLFDRDGRGRSALLIAAEGGKSAIVAFLLQRKVDVDARDMEGNTALHLSARIGSDAVVKLLVGAGASVRIYNKRCESPLDWAAGAVKRPVFDLMMKRAATAALPSDGTKEECKLGKALSTFDVTTRAFHERRLVIASADDYYTAYESLKFLAANPTQVPRLSRRISDVIVHSTPPGGEALEGWSSAVRNLAVTVLTNARLDKRQTAAIGDRLLPTVALGGCAAYHKAMCDDEQQTSCSMADLKESLGFLLSYAFDNATRPPPPEWPRSAEKERCFTCSHCPKTGVEQGLTASLAWFRAHPELAPKAHRALDRLKKRGHLSAAELKALKSPNSKP